MNTNDETSEIPIQPLQFAEFYFTSSDNDRFFLLILKCYINPAISIFGLAANFLGMTILRSSGLNKASNVLLFGLALADSLAIFFTINVAEMLLFFDPTKKYPRLAGWQYDQNVSFILYLLRSAFYFVGDWGAYVNTTIPAIITCERLVAIFSPLHFKKYITAKFAVVSVVISFVFWIPLSAFFHYVTPFDYVRISNTTHMGIWKLSDYYINNSRVILIVNNYVFEIMSSWAPVCFVTVGCIAIWVKVKVTMKKRRNLGAADRCSNTSTRTTKTLLATCAFFASTHFLYSVLIYIFDPDFFIYQKQFIVYEIMHSIYLINNSSNFFVYVAFNKKLWLIFKRMVFPQSRKRMINY
ncbi:G-protein coupled receptor [Biomphalaria pfeifferi]|uniref:G-protein coupled receptor n=1 Tax=Biomphalaria pfeifferi TaxID=112525 RepID=A0AAD8AUI3_BIOPF|nr:G-protein coupled receptor [Biomphalaria pfeifferi]